MLRAIDTQTIYQQTQELSNRQQVHNQGENIQQGQFAHIMQKQTEQKKETVNETKKDEKIDNDLNKSKKNKENNKKQQGKENRKKSSANGLSEQCNNENKIDIRI